VTIRPIRFILFCLSLIIIISSCKRINEATDLGGNVIPGADGVNTFDTTLTSLETYNNIYTNDNDSVKVFRFDDQIIGNIVDDPIFGKTNAKLFLELKPDVYPWTFSGIYKPDSLTVMDSVVLILSWSGSYGDTVQTQKFNVYEIHPFSDFRIDTFMTIRDPGFQRWALLGSKTFSPRNLKDSVKAYQDTTAGQLRIKLDNSFGRRLLDYDTTTAYGSDSAFKKHFKGFEIAAEEGIGNGLMAFGINNNANTKLAIYYKYRSGGQDIPAVSYFRFTNTSANHNYVNRFDFNGTSWKSTANDQVVDSPIYLINTPGTYATVKIPALRNMSNRVVNRAELIVEQLYDPSNVTFQDPDAIMLDVYDSTLGGYKFVPFDFLPDPQSGIPNANFGLYGQKSVDVAGNPIRVWKFNITRYVQNVLTKQEPLHNFRLYITQTATERMREGAISNTGGYRYINVLVNPFHAFGRVKVGGGQKMRLRIVYTKI